MNDYKEQKILFKEVSKGDNNVIRITGAPSTADVDRENEIVATTAFANSIKTYMNASGSVFYNHDWDKPIGKIIDYVLPTEQTPLIITAEIYPLDEFAYKAIEYGIIKSFSVGFIPKQIISERDETGRTISRKITDAELLDISVVSVPANPYANFSIIKSMLKGKSKDEIMKILDNEGFKDNKDSDEPQIEGKTDEEYISVKKSEMDRLLKSVDEIASFSLRLIEKLEAMSNKEVIELLNKLKMIKE